LNDVKVTSYRITKTFHDYRRQKDILYWRKGC